MTKPLIPPHCKNVPKSISALVAYALRRPGLELGNYGFGKAGRAAYFAESRQITKDLDSVRDAVAAALAAGVNDLDLEYMCSRAFSGRLRVKDGQVDYCTGQYWPTEYRKAVAAVLNYAASHKC